MSTASWIIDIFFIGLGSVAIFVALAQDDWYIKILLSVVGLFFYTLMISGLSVDVFGLGRPQTYLEVGHYKAVLCRRDDTAGFHDCWVDLGKGKGVRWLRIPKALDKSWSDLPPSTFAPDTDMEIYKYNDDLQVRGSRAITH